MSRVEKFIPATRGSGGDLEYSARRAAARRMARLEREAASQAPDWDIAGEALTGEWARLADLGLKAPRGEGDIS